MSNVHPFPKRTPEQQFRAIQPEVYKTPPLAPVHTLRTPEFHVPFLNAPAKPAETLETALDDYRSTLLELAHKRQAFELQMHVEQSTAQIRLEASAYKALLTGVPESDIYALGEDMAEALESAMNTVAGS